ncbi:RodZ domain-containing protein [[Haemophilus] ducreyi]|uniref:RodZ domain-containing protein n=1 Tax=Haemophilus ducreyi TaxID=730 RepID=UPI00065523F4|nr:RodZ domain-containing protein [[Haemophilus] ducreyi]AKO45364.1 DNA-binding protein [[Haemophilus] ducreyi]AKO46749.1 DNA-binding protein [[Haemophilus] ducreyi]AKO48089.1 DNA-binding protein [[Haemophilus] ducreyi]AKO49475.1 DNA-binding protein [[Haemophilus] ducreyi]ANF61488.1 DNA-binding protein [[Haemophilus] ducreyi]
MTESINPKQENQAKHSLGHKLKQAREALNLTIEDVAKKTNLKKSHIEALENDIFILQNVAPTFVRGYVRNYLRFLRLPKEWGDNVNYGEVILPKEVSNMASATTTEHKSQTKWVKSITVLILLAAISMTLLWWWQDYQQEQKSREQFVNNVTQEEPSALLTALVEPEQPSTLEANIAEQSQSSVKTELHSSPPSTTLGTIEALDEPVNILQQINPEVAAADAIKPSLPDTQEVATSNDELRIEITGKESWIAVKVPNSKKSLVEKLYANGEVLTFNGNEQYHLTIGAPANVKIYYKGEPVLLKIDGRVARIKLPLVQQ